jgi:peptide/nickel transport system substrate-binding protein
MMVPKKLLKILIFCLTSLVLIANIHCRKAENRITRDPQTVVWLVNESVIQGWGPSFEDHILHSPLFLWDETGRIGHLVDKWEHSTDYRTWTYTLHKNIKWHDGVPFTTQDIEFTYEFARRPDVLWARPDGSTLKIIDDFTFSITFHDNDAYSPTPYSGRYLPKHLLEPLLEKMTPDELGSTFEFKYKGCGPFRYVRHVPKTMLELEANPDYFLGKPKIERLILKYGGNPVTELFSGHVDIITTALGDFDLIKLAKERDFNLYYQPGNNSAIYWNHNTPFFEDKNVRKALTMAMDRREIFRLFQIPDEVPVTDLKVNWGTDWNPRMKKEGSFPKAIPFDPEKASQLLDQAGWRDQDGDGIREREGQTFKFTLLTDASRSRAAVLIQEHLRRVGVQMEIQTIAGQVMMGRVEGGKFDAFHFGYGSSRIRRLIAGINDDGEGEIKSLIGYTNPDLIRAFKEAEGDWDPDAFEKMITKINKAIVPDTPATVLQPNLYATIAHKRIKGFSTPNRAFPGPSMEHLWIEEE